MRALNEGLVRCAASGREGLAWPMALVVIYGVPLVIFGAGRMSSPRFILGSLVLAISLITLSEIDRKTFRLPDLITTPLMLVGVLAVATTGEGMLWQCFSAALGLALMLLVDQVYRAWRGTSGIGRGDAKLFAASGAWLGAHALPVVLLGACASALLVLLAAHMLGRRLEARTAIPFGPFLAFGTWLVWCLGPLP
jgi:prepilin signal peptidase PulO-like enzyme (type II secretory pathway)